MAEESLLNATTLEAIFTAVMYGADKIPDSWFEKVPGGYYRTKEEKEKARRKEEKAARHARRHPETDPDDGDDEPYHSDDLNDRGDRSRDSDDYGDEDYSGRDHYRRPTGKGQGGNGYDGARYENAPLGRTYEQPRPYQPAEYANPGVHDGQDYYHGRSQGMDGTIYAPPVVAAGTAGAAGAMASHYTEANTRPISTSGPTRGYVPYAYLYENEPQSPRQTKLQRDAERYPHNDGSSNGSDTTRYPRKAYVESASDSYHSRASDDSRHHRHRHHHRDQDSSTPRHKSRPRARSSLGDRFDTTDKGLGYGTIGALAGGLLGNEFGNGGIGPSIAGAVAGGLGANAYEGRSKHKKDDHRSSKHEGRYDDRHDNRRKDRYDDAPSSRQNERYDDGHRRHRHRSRRNEYHSD